MLIIRIAELKFKMLPQRCFASKLPKPNSPKLSKDSLCGFTSGSCPNSFSVLQISGNFSKFRIFNFPSNIVLKFLPSSQLGNGQFWNSFLVSLILPNFQFQVQVLLFTALVSCSPAYPELSLRIICPTTFLFCQRLQNSGFSNLK